MPDTVIIPGDPLSYPASPRGLESPDSIRVSVDVGLRDLPGTVGREVERKLAAWLQATYGTAGVA